MTERGGMDALNLSACRVSGLHLALSRQFEVYNKVFISVDRLWDVLVAWALREVRSLGTALFTLNHVCTEVEDWGIV